MIRLFVTGDNHFGRRFDRYQARKTLVDSRYDCLEDMVKEAEREHCDFFVVTGDLFDRTSGIPKKDIRRVVEILGRFNQRLLILPGNHDYYNENEDLWKDVAEAADACSNIVIMNEYRAYPFEVGEERVVFYPAYCDKKHSETDRLDWIRQAEVPAEGQYSIGVAHGALEGLAIDTEGQYFPMSRTQLHALPMDVWLLGHAHVTEPMIPEGVSEKGHRIFNAGTHEQLDLHNRTEGNCFVIDIEEADGLKTVTAKRFRSGRIRYLDQEISFDAQGEETLEHAIREATRDYPDSTIVRLRLRGSIRPEDYQDRRRIYEDCLGGFLEHVINDADLSETITIDKIRDEFSEVSFAAKFLEALVEDPVELQMAYDLVRENQGAGEGSGKY